MTRVRSHVAEAHARELPDPVSAASLGDADLDSRILRMLGARGKTVANAEAFAGGERSLSAT